MPIEACTLNGKPGWRWGKQGRCYTYRPNSEASSNEAKRRAHVQGYAIEQNGGRSVEDGIWRKEFSTEHKRQQPGDSDLEAIGKYALEPVKADQVFIGQMKLCNDQYDRTHERFAEA